MCLSQRALVTTRGLSQQEAPLTQQTGIQRAVDAAGSQRALASILGVSQQAVAQWVARGYAPASRVVEIEAQLGVPRADLIQASLRDLLLD